MSLSIAAGDLDDVTPTVSVSTFAATMATMDADEDAEEDADDEDAVQVALPPPAEGEWEEVVERTVVVADGIGGLVCCCCFVYVVVVLYIYINIIRLLLSVGC
jgi:hypothetical protein